MDNSKGTKNTEKRKLNMHQNKKKTCMRTVGKEKQNLVYRRKNAQQQNQSGARREPSQTKKLKKKQKKY